MKRYFSYLFFLFIGSSHLAAYKAVCIVPVADLIGESMRAIKIKPGAVSSYQEIPYAENGCSFGCPRLHQLLFNEIVTVHEVAENEALIEIPNLFYHTTTNTKRVSRYWTQTKNIYALHDLNKKGIETKTFPVPFSYQKGTSLNIKKNIIVLTKPYFDPVTKKRYSAGTRFVRSGITNENNKFLVMAFDPQKIKFQIIAIPRSHALLQHSPTKRLALNRFINIVRSWATIPNAAIPYVWGGCSVGQPIKQGSFEKATIKGKAVYSWITTQKRPKEGVDCAGLVARAAQLAGLPYYFKNTTTLAAGLRSLKKGEAVEDGDLIWIRGHVMIVSNKNKGLLAEARHYNHGYGIVHEIPLHEEFKGIKTYKELADAALNKKALLRLNKSGKVVQKINVCKILKMASLFE